MNQSYTFEDQPPETRPDSPQPDDRIKHWQGEIDAALKREEGFRKDGDNLVEMYEGGQRDEVPFNILYSNTETLSPALYNNTPRPVVKPRYRSTDPVPKASADLTSSFLEFFIDTGDSDAETFDTLILAALHEALVPGRGLTRFDYDADIEYGSDKEPKRVRREYICGKPVPFNRVCHGYAKTWNDVPWVCFTHYLSREEVDSRKSWTKTEGTHIVFATAKEDEDKPQIKEATGVQVAKIYEVWDRWGKKVLFFCEGAEQFLEEKDDEYKLTGFFNIPRPLTFVTKISGQVPRALYTLYENQARELNSVTNRIKVVIRAIKAVGFYNPQIEGLEKVLELEDGMMHPLQGVGALGDGTALQNAVWMWPAEKLVIVLQQLLEQRSAIKQVIYEITGISDILRGASVANETATAQSLKNQWGSLRIKRFQKEVARYVKDCLRIAAELGFTKLSKETLFRATATSLPYQKDWDAAKARVQAIQLQAQQAQLMAPEGQPPAPPPQPSPNDLALLQKPIFETVLEGLKNDLHRKYLIDIELNSTVDVEATEDKTNLTDFLGAMAQFFAGVGPLVESGTLPWGAAKAMMLTISRKFRLGRDLDDELNAMQQPSQQPGQGGEQMAKVQAEQVKLEKDKSAFQITQIQGKAQTDSQQANMKIAGLQHSMKMQENETRALITALQAGVKDQKVKSELEKLLIKLQAKHQEMEGDAQAISSQLQSDHQLRQAETKQAELQIAHSAEREQSKLAEKEQGMVHKHQIHDVKQQARDKAAAAKTSAKGK